MSLNEKFIQRLITKSKALSSKEKVDDAKESQIDDNSQAVLTEVD